jgi:nucleotide-binding universal stress UspA family protein
MKILLPVDGSTHTKRMLSYIAAHDELLGRSHDYVIFTAVAPLPLHITRYVDQGVFDSHEREQAEQVLRPIKAFADQQGWNVQLMHEVGYATEAIVALANRIKPDLIVMGTQGHSALANLLLGSVTTGVLARCQVPVLLIR